MAMIVALASLDICFNFIEIFTAIKLDFFPRVTNTIIVFLSKKKISLNTNNHLLTMVRLLALAQIDSPKGNPSPRSMPRTQVEHSIFECLQLPLVKMTLVLVYQLQLLQIGDMD